MHIVNTVVCKSLGGMCNVLVACWKQIITTHILFANIILWQVIYFKKIVYLYLLSSCITGIYSDFLFFLFNKNMWNSG
jgi:hypothetical protein